MFAPCYVSPHSVDVSSASASGEMNMRSENQGDLYTSQAAGSYLRFSATASACADWISAWATHKSTLGLNLNAPKLCTEEMSSTHVFIIMLHLPLQSSSGALRWVCSFALTV